MQISKVHRKRSIRNHISKFGSFCVLTGLILFTGCDFLLTNWNLDERGNGSGNGKFRSEWNVTSVKAYDDVRWGNLTAIESQIDTSLIPTLWFNQRTVLPSKFVTFANRVIDSSKNPGLGVRALHAQGLTGRGVNVAIIDQNIISNHPEYAGKVIKYHTVGDMPTDGSMHGPAVLSLLVGNSIGTAPGAQVYFAAAPSWNADAKYQADALRWIISENKLLPADRKIRAVSISAAPSGPGSPFTKNNSDWDAARNEAEAEDIIVLDCTSDNGKTAACFYNPTNPELVSDCTPGYPGYSVIIDTNRLYIPVSKRTTAEEYVQGENGYQYTGRGGLSWSIPYLTGILAIGWQVRPDLTGKEMLGRAFSSAYIKDGAKIINPSAFIDSVRNYHK